MWETIFGGLMGGIFRIIPEVLKWLDRRDERKHERAMQDKVYAFQKLRGHQRIEEMQTQGQMDWDKGSLEALRKAIAGQDKPSGIKWIDGWNKLIRPAMATQWVLLLWPAVIIASFYFSVQSGTPSLTAFAQVFGPEEKAFAGAIANFFILNRVFDRVK